jgi:uncharacterized protein YndB with AHSA1/START domain
MPGIYHNFVIKASPSKVFANIQSSKGLDNWWTKASEVRSEEGGIFSLHFGAGYNWKAVVTKFIPDQAFELRFTEADEDWLGTRAGFILKLKNQKTEVNFYHTGWPSENEHFKISCYCWAMYLRILKRYIELGERVPYENRLDA